MLNITPNERAALERFRITQTTMPDKYNCWHHGDEVFGEGTAEDDLHELAEAMDRLCPADDDEPILKSWLFSIGGKREDSLLQVAFERKDRLPIGLWDADDGWKAMLILAPNHAVCIVRGLKTRGQLRSLAAALGIELGGGE